MQRASMRRRHRASPDRDDATALRIRSGDAAPMVSLTLVLTFPTGRLEGVPESLIWGTGVVTIVGATVVSFFVSPVLVPAGSISGCAGACPPNALLTSPDLSLAHDLLQV